VRPHTWSLKKKIQQKASSSTIGPSIRYFILIPTSSRVWNAQVYSSATCWWWRCRSYDLCYLPKWDSSILWIECKHRATYISHPKPSTSTSSVTILSSVTLFTRIQCNQDTFSLTQPQQNLIEPKTSSFTQLLFAPFSTNFLDSQAFDATKDQPHPYLSTPIVKPTSSTQPNEPEFTPEPGLPNEELDPFSEDRDKVLHNQPKSKMMRKKLSLFHQ